VPLGAALSGGIDSSSVVCAIRYLDPKVRIDTFSYIARGSAVDEEKWVDLVNNHVNSIPHKVLVQSNEFINDIDDFILSQGEPMGGVSFYVEHRLYKLAKEAGIKVMLDGHGADEVFGGYVGYPTQRIRSLIDIREFQQALSFAKSWGAWPGRGPVSAIKSLLGGIYSSISGQDPKTASQFLRSKYWLSSKIFRYGGINRSSARDTRFQEYFGRRLVSELNRELCSTSCPPQLRCADRSAMRRSIENRVPFLNPDVVEYALKLPESYLVSNNGLTKSVFRHAMRDIVPSQILDRRDKIGYAAPSGQAIDNCEPLIRSLESSCDRFPALNKGGVLSLITGGGKPSVCLDGISWRLFNFLRWAELYDVSE
jgi:asparagine synthase (glutamine-hydrolysing)